MFQRKIKNLQIRQDLSFWAVILIVVVFFGSDMLHHQWMRDEPPVRGVIKYDVSGYYSYLPAVFIFGDYKLEFTGKEGFRNESRFQYLRLEDNKRLIQYTSGLAILYSPFFLMAHLSAPLFGELRDGYNWVYQFFLVLSALFYVSVGLIFLRKLLLKYFSDLHTAIALILIGLGTNLYYYSVYEAAMSHSYSFSFIALFIYFVDKWYRTPDVRTTIRLGLIYGMLVLIRPTNALVLVLLVLWNIKNFEDVKMRLQFLLRRIPLLLLMILFFIIPWIPQLLYWKSVTGHIFYNSYDKVGSAFYLNAPQTLNMLFSYRKGWFIYTPIMFFAFGGFIVLFKQYRELFWSTLVYTVLMIYLMSSWWAWWFGGGFGSRSMVDIYAVMAFPLAALISKIFEFRRLFLTYAFLGIFALLFALNWMQIAQYNHGSIHYVSMDKDAYWHNYFKVKGRGVWPYLSEPDHTLGRLGIYYYYDWSEDYDAFRTLGVDAGHSLIQQELSSNAKTMRSIHRHARRNEMSDEEALQLVIDRVYDMKSTRENLQ